MDSQRAPERRRLHQNKKGNWKTSCGKSVTKLGDLGNEQLKYDYPEDAQDQEMSKADLVIERVSQSATC